MNRFATIVVTYFPDAETLNRIVKLSGQCCQVIVVDNTPDNLNIDFINNKNTKVLKNQKNEGLAFALNRGIDWAGKNGIQNIFLLDQDSRPPENYFSSMITFKMHQDRQYDRWAFFVPNFYDRNSKTFAKFPHLTRFSLAHATCKNFKSIRKIRAVIAITSGMLITYSRYREIGPFRDDYFIDFIDNEYCLRATKKGYRVRFNCDVVLDHAIGRRSLQRFCGVTIKPNHHPPLRRYYIARNGTRTAMDFAVPFPSYLSLLFARMVHELISILAYEKQKSKKIYALMQGFYHGLIGKMGKCQIDSLYS